MTSRTTTPRTTPPDAVLAAVLLLGLALRLGFAAGHMGNVHPDEVFQYLEQAHRVVFSEGQIPWEYQVQARSWILPGLLLPAMALQRALMLGPTALYWVVAAQMAVLGLLPIYAGYRLGMRAAGPRGALLAGLLNAVWFECVHYSTHMLPDVLAAALLPLALWCAVSARTGRERLLAGVLWGLVIAVRIQIAPIAGLGLLLTAWPSLRGFAVQVAGVLIVALGYGLVDFMTLGVPFLSIVNYLKWNVLQNVAGGFGVWPWYSYGVSFAANWSVALPLVAIAAIYGRRVAALEWALSLAVIGVLSLVGHKEERFVYPAIPLILTACGIGSACLLDRWPGRRWLGAGVACVWHAASLGLSFTPRFALRAEHGTAAVAAMHTASRQPDLCGLGIAPPDMYVNTGGLAALRPGTPVFAAGADASDYNYVLSDDETPPPGFARAGCWSEPGGRKTVRMCVFRRPGGCRAGSAPPITLPMPAPVVEAIARKATAPGT